MTHLGAVEGVVGVEGVSMTHLGAAEGVVGVEGGAEVSPSAPHTLRSREVVCSGSRSPAQIRIF